MTLWNTTHTHRWHNNPSHALRNSGDTVAAHSARVALLVMELFPDHAGGHLLRVTLTHDLAESFTGDTPAPAKKHWQLGVALGMAEAEWGAEHDIPEPFTKREADILRLCDKLDAYLWVKHVDPQVLHMTAWIDARRTLLTTARELNVHDKVEELLK